MCSSWKKRFEDEQLDLCHHMAVPSQSRGLVVTPDDSRIAVFNSRICKWLSGEIPIGGHKDAISIVGDKLIVEINYTFYWNPFKNRQIASRIILHLSVDVLFTIIINWSCMVDGV